MQPRVALNALALRPQGSGVQTYIRELLRALPDVVDADLAAAVQRDALGELPVGIEPIERPVRAGALRALHGLRGMGPADLVHGLDVDLPVRAGAPTVTTVHDLSVFDVPSTFSRRRSAGERWLVRRAVTHADAVITVSDFTAERVDEMFGRQATVTRLAPGPVFRPATSAEIADIRDRYSLPSRFVLHVGSTEPRKGATVLAEACHAIDIPLVIAGASNARAERIRGTRLGYVPEPEMPALYGAATVVAYVSSYEGFGLPPVEAAASGAAVIATRVGALADVLEGGAEFVPVGDAGALSSRLRVLVDDNARRRALAEAGRKCVSRLSWSETARRTADVYRSLGVAV